MTENKIKKNISIPYSDVYGFDVWFTHFLFESLYDHIFWPLDL